MLEEQVHQEDVVGPDGLKWGKRALKRPSHACCMGLYVLNPGGGSIRSFGRSEKGVPREAEIKLKVFQGGLEELPSSILLAVTMFQ